MATRPPAQVSHPSLTMPSPSPTNAGGNSRSGQRRNLRRHDRDADQQAARGFLSWKTSPVWRSAQYVHGRDRPLTAPNWARTSPCCVGPSATILGGAIPHNGRPRGGGSMVIGGGGKGRRGNGIFNRNAVDGGGDNDDDNHDGATLECDERGDAAREMRKANIGFLPTTRLPFERISVAPALTMGGPERRRL
jgi:hypothetical protein